MEYNSIYNYILFLFKFRSTNTIPFFKDGNAVVTHFSGENLLPNPNGYVLKIIETKNATFQKKGENWSAPAFDKPSWRASTLGEIFGICIDSSKIFMLHQLQFMGKLLLELVVQGQFIKLMQ